MIFGADPSQSVARVESLLDTAGDVPVRRRWWRRVGRFDQALFDAVAAAQLPGLDHVLPRLSRVADRSMLWWGIAGAMGLSGQVRLRRAGLRGVVGIMIASPLINIVGKQMFRRARPRVDLVPPIRIRWRLPTSPAFPSGHSASAAAFATGVALEAPASVALPVAGLAAGVAVSRVYTGAHYPGDVLAGVAMGGAAGLLTRLIWPIHIRRAAALPQARQGGRDTEEAGVVVVVNNGAARAAAIVGQLTRELPDAEIVTVGRHADLDAVLHDAARRAGVLAVAGGDGTVNAGARAALAGGVPLLTIPSGTLNHFARTIGIDSVADALAAYRSGRLVRVDVGRISASGATDQIFLNTAAFGAYSKLADRRDRLRRRIGRWPALAVATFRTLRHTVPVDVEVNGTRCRVLAGFVGNCRYASWGPLPTGRARLADGQLDVRLMLTGRRGGRVRRQMRLLFARVPAVRRYRSWPTTTLRLQATAPLHLTYDGEATMVTPPVRFTKQPAALGVFQP
jgi:diacylglycerol kinase family enzyme/membrane-associated phospholipid phosphatase